MMPQTTAASPVQRKRRGMIVSVAIVAAALITGLIVIAITDRYPRTDDAEVFANFIGIAPQVEGPLMTLPVQDNEFVKQGGLLFEIDPRPYEYALEKAKSDLSTLEGQIVDESRTIASQQSAAERGAGLHAECGSQRDHAASAVNEAQANVESSKAELDAIAGGIRIHQQQLPSHRAAAGQAVRHRRSGRSGKNRSGRGKAGGRPGALAGSPGGGAVAVG